MQGVACFLRVYLLMQFVSRSVITGFVNALAILIFLAQVPQLTGLGWETYAMVAGGLSILHLLPRLTTAVPSPLVAIIVPSPLSIWLALPVHTDRHLAELPSTLPYILLPDLPHHRQTPRDYPPPS